MVALSFDILLRGAEAARRGIRGLGDEADGVSDRFEGMKKAMATGAAAAGVTAGGLLAKGFSDNLDLEAGRAKLGAQLGLTAAKSEQVGKSAGKLYAANYGESMEAVNETIGSVIQNIDGMRDASAASLENISKKVSNLQNTTGETSDAITRSISQMLRTGLAKNADEALDIVTKGFQNGANKSEDFLDTLNEYGTQFRKLGIDGTTATGLISQGLKAGARDGDLVADSIKEFTIRAIDGSESTKEGFKAIGLNAKDMSKKIAAGGPEAQKALGLTLDKLRAMKDPTKQAAAAVQLFGTQAEDMGQALYALDTDTAAKGLGKVAGAAEEMDKTLGSTGKARIEMMKRGFEQWTQKMAGSEGALGSITGVVVGFAGPGLAMAGSLGAMVSGLAAMNVGAIASAASTGASTAATVIWSATTKIAGVTATVFSVALRGVGMAMTFATGPVGLIIIAIAAAAAGIIYAYKHSEKFRTIVKGAMEATGKAVNFMWNNVMKPAFRFIIDAWLGVAGGIVHGAAKAFGWMPGLGPKLKRAANEFDKFRDQVNNSLDGIKDEKVTVRLNTEASVYGTKGGHYVGSTFVKYARGGRVWGAGTETSDSIPAYLSHNEHVWTAAEVRGAGGHDAVSAMRKDALNGYALGGSVTGSSIAGKVDGAREKIAKLGEARMQSYFKVMNKGLNGALNFARQESGKPYIWGGVGPRGYDCSGFMSALLNVVQGKNPHQRRFATGSFPSAGFVPGYGAFAIGSRRGNPGHMAGTILGTNVESSGGVGVHMGASARGARNSLFTGVYHLKGYKTGGAVGGDPPFDLLSPQGYDYMGDEVRRAALYDEGGILRPGGIGRNRSGRPERVLSGRQTAAFDQMVRVIDRGMRSGAGNSPAGAEIDYAKLGDHVTKAFIRAGVTVNMDGRAVGTVLGNRSSLQGRAG